MSEELYTKWPHYYFYCSSKDDTYYYNIEFTTVSKEVFLAYFKGFLKKGIKLLFNGCSMTLEVRDGMVQEGRPSFHLIIPQYQSKYLPYPQDVTLFFDGKRIRIKPDLNLVKGSKVKRLLYREICSSCKEVPFEIFVDKEAEEGKIKIPILNAPFKILNEWIDLLIYEYYINPKFFNSYEEEIFFCDRVDEYDSERY